MKGMLCLLKTAFVRIKIFINCFKRKFNVTKQIVSQLVSGENRKEFKSEGPILRVDIKEDIRARLTTLE